MNDYDGLARSENIYFYEVLVGDEKITLLERFLDGTVCTEEESD